MRQVRELVRKAWKDFELAKRHRRIKEYVTATLLYNTAVEKVLTALFINKTRRSPPANASIEYLAMRTGMPPEITTYISTMQQDAAGSYQDPEFMGLEREANAEQREERDAFFMDGLAQRLLDYVTAYVRI